MVTKKAAGKKPGNLKLKKETIRDLDAKRSVKGGAAMATGANCRRIGPAGTTAIGPQGPPASAICASANCIG